MDRSKVPPVVVVAVAVGAVATLLVLGVLVDRQADAVVAANPFTANLVAALMLVPVEAVVVAWILRWWLARRDRHRWLAVRVQLGEAIGARWTRLRGLLIARYGLDDLDERHAVIAAADELWASLHEQQERQSFELQGTDSVEWELPTDADEPVAAASGIWYQAWGAGVEIDERALARRLTAVQLPRLNLEDPELAASVHGLVDAIEDLADLREVLNNWHDPFPTVITPGYSPFNDQVSV